MTAVRRVHLVPHTHHDVGYTNSPRIVDAMHARIVTRVLDLVDADTAGDDAPDAFRWTFEVARPVLSWLRTAGDADVERLRDQVARGRIAVTGGYLNMTQLPSASEFDAAYELLDRVRELGIPVRTEQHGDVNGIAWGVVPAMRRAGLGRLLMALNPDHGRPPAQQPTGAWWRGPGDQEVFVWLSTHYGLGEEWGIVDGDVESADRRISDHLARLADREDLPFTSTIVHAGNDNRWPTAVFRTVVRAWNARHPDVPMRVSTVDQALDDLEAQARAAGDRVPVFRGEWADWWAHGHGSTARDVAAYREAGTFLAQGAATLALDALRAHDPAETEDGPALATVLGYRRGPVRLRSDDEVRTDLAQVDEQLLLFGEHTWGSWETYSKPDSTFNRSHANASAGNAYAAYDLARDLAVEGWYRLATRGTDEPAPAATPAATDLVVVNPTETHRAEPVETEVDGGRRVRAVVAVPPFATVVVPLPADATAVEPATAPDTAGQEARLTVDGTVAVLDTARWHLEVDAARGGVVSLLHRASRRELVDLRRGFGLGAVVTESPEAGSTHPMLTVDPKRFRPEDPGPRFVQTAAVGAEQPTMRRGAGWTSVTWRTWAVTVPAVETTITVHDDVDMVDLSVTMHKPYRRGPESVFVAFPWRVDGPRFLVETAGAVFVADAEQLPDTSRDWYSVQHAVGVVGEDGSGVLWTTRDVPLVQLGGFHTGQWAERLDVQDGLVASWVADTLHFTNFQPGQDASGTYRYRFAPRDGIDAVAVARAGRDAALPLAARALPPGTARPGGTGVTVTVLEGDPDAVLVALRPVGDAVRARVRNVGVDAVVVRVQAPGGSGSVRVEPADAGDVLLPA
ncbi:hypothetical protein [Curtobacterium sp. 9128]|uniref:glycoside hydrolase family 38 N-terminal domain-containing protein n=1 Tax=Curtobacterium sp. 9128 TaxID=1793722 RepID=UPI0011A52D6E|nr:hypothetical protein [Curtobacterium sp. 9128]